MTNRPLNSYPLTPDLEGIQEKVDPFSIPLEHGIQIRIQLSQKVVSRYKDMMSGGTKFDPVQVIFTDVGRVRLVDGFHRVRAAREGGLPISVEVRRGTELDALTAALVANTRHGKQLTKRDLRNGYRLAWESLEDFRRLSYRRKEELTGVPKSTIHRWEKELNMDWGEQIEPVRGTIMDARSRLQRVSALEKFYGQHTPPTPGSPEARRLAALYLAEVGVTPEDLIKNRPSEREFLDQSMADDMAEKTVAVAAQIYHRTMEGAQAFHLSAEYVKEDDDSDF